MAKRNQNKKSAEDKEPSIGEMMNTNVSPRERNLAMRAKLIEAGEMEEVEDSKPAPKTQRERNLAVRAQLEKEVEDGKDAE